MTGRDASSHSMSNGQCLRWRRSTRSTFQGSCVEVQYGVHVRDSKLAGASPVLSFTPAAWQAFLDRVRAAGSA